MPDGGNKQNKLEKCFKVRNHMLQNNIVRYFKAFFVAKVLQAKWYNVKINRHTKDTMYCIFDANLALAYKRSNLTVRLEVRSMHNLYLLYWSSLERGLWHAGKGAVRNAAARK